MGRILGLDYGKKRIGLAVTDEMQIISSPLDVYIYDDLFIDKLRILHEKYNFEKIVIGYPYSEKYFEASKEVEIFAESLKQLGISIEFQNEEFTSVFAGSLLKSMNIGKKGIKSKIDKYAAQKILEDYLKKRSGT